MSSVLGDVWTGHCTVWIFQHLLPFKSDPRVFGRCDPAAWAQPHLRFLLFICLFFYTLYVLSAKLCNPVCYILPHPAASTTMQAKDSGI
jgi:hypothetical protein